MRKSFLFLAVAAVFAFGLITISKRRAPEKSEAAARMTNADKRLISAFWETYNKATALRLHGAFHEAALAYQECLRLNPAHEDSLYYLGSSLEELGDYAQAARTFGRLTVLNPSSGRAFSELGNSLSTLGPGSPADFGQARKAYYRCIQINREQAGPFLRLGLLDLNQGRYESALEDLRIAAGFGSPEADFLLGYVFFLQGKYEQSLQPLRKVVNSYARDRKIAARGVLSEGDLLPAPGKPLTALEKAGLRSILLLYWIAQQLDGYPAGIPSQFRLQKPPKMDGVFRPAGAGIGLRGTGRRAAGGDFDQDGQMDLLVVGSGLPVTLYRNEGGVFRDVTQRAGLKGARDVWDAYWIDYDGDGYPDLYLIRPGYVGTGQNTLYHNNRNGTFTDLTARTGLAGERSTARACFSDFSGHGRLDLLEVGASGLGRQAVRFFRNAEDRFVEQSELAGFDPQGAAVDCAVGDYNRDGRPDVFVLYWHRDGILYANAGSGKFSDVTERAGLRGLRGEGFSALFFDFDRDGSPDLLVTSHAPPEEVARCLLQPNFTSARFTPRLFRNTGAGWFEEVTSKMGLNRCYGTLQALTADFDSDGWPDLLLVSGSLDRLTLEPSVILRNFQGKAFHEWSYLPSYDQPGNFFGAAVAQFNQDGLPDIFLGRHPLTYNEQSLGILYVNRLSR